MPRAEGSFAREIGDLVLLVCLASIRLGDVHREMAPQRSVPASRASARAWKRGRCLD
jgi:hypothetical protein